MATFWFSQKDEAKYAKHASDDARDDEILSPAEASDETDGGRG